ncbi:UNVERIFIED_CONTAM: hypothetical protein RMT77_002796 [Armadillidium vulgare]
MDFFYKLSRSLDYLLIWIHVFSYFLNTNSLPFCGIMNAYEERPYYLMNIARIPSKRSISDSSKSEKDELDERARSTWHGGIVPYVFSPDFVDEIGKKNILNAMQIFENRTNGCVKFIERTTEVDYIYIVAMKECFSYIGRIGGAQKVDLATGCKEFMRYIFHELFHVLGFEHEHIRPDRDQYISVQYENIIDDYKSDFNITNHFKNFPESYDYESIVHYPELAFSKNGNRTIITKDPKYQHKIGTSKTLSEIDISKIKRIYKC